MYQILQLLKFAGFSHNIAFTGCTNNITFITRGCSNYMHCLKTPLSLSDKRSNEDFLVVLLKMGKYQRFISHFGFEMLLGKDLILRLNFGIYR